MREALVVSLLLSLAAPAHGSDRKPWEAGAYSFSDELGGFAIVAVRGTGRPDDPVVITQELPSSSPVTLMIRAIRPIRPYDSADNSVNGTLRLRLETLNGSGQSWVEFEFELQELRDQPSLFGDGLSFDQRRVEGQNIVSDSYASFDRDFEPYDRLRFTDGRIDPGRSGMFEFTITDYTPRPVFYLVQDPRIPSS